MSDKKHIDRLFQEKFKDFEAKPSANVWAGIQSKMELPQEKTKTVFPFWLRFVGIAAALVLLFTAGDFVFNNTNIVDTKTINNSNSEKNNTTNIVLTEDLDSLKQNKDTIGDKNELLENTDIVSNENDSNNNTPKTPQKNVNGLNRLVPNSKNALIKDIEKTNASVVNQNYNTTSKVKITTINTGNKTVLNTVSNPTLHTETNTSEKINSTVSTNSQNNKVVTNQNNVPKKLAEKINIPNSKNNATENAITNNNIVNNSTNNTNLVTGDSSNENKQNPKTASVLDNNNTISNTDIATTDSEKKKEEEKMMEPDSANSSNTIEEALAKTKDLDEKEENVNRWSVNANAAPVYYNTLGNGSHIHEQFIDNPKNGEINTSYGINVGYALNDRLKVRSGINKLNLSYDTANVIVYENVTSTPSSSPLRNIDFIPTSEGQNISVLSSNSLNVQQIDGFINDDLNAALSQRLSYVEVPLELEYTVVKKRFGVNLIGGFSTFFLSDNEVVTEVDNRKTKIGEANNINNLSFSANAGIGIDYKFNKSLKFNLEPTFKYQINAYNETSGDFKPYIIGVYTGISYKF